jgi:hypothetical protein
MLFVQQGGKQATEELRQKAEETSRSHLLFTDGLLARLSVADREKKRLQEQVERDRQTISKLQADLQGLQAKLQQACMQKPADDVQLARTRAQALKQVEHYESLYMDCYLTANEKVSNWKYAEQELDAMDEAYFRFSFCMRECSKRVAAG